MEWLAGEKTKVTGTFPPTKRERGWTGYVEKDTAGQTNIYSVEVSCFIRLSCKGFSLNQVLQLFFLSETGCAYFLFEGYICPFTIYLKPFFFPEDFPQCNIYLLK